MTLGIVGQDTVVNSDKNIHWMRLQLELAELMAEIVRKDATDKLLKEKECCKKHGEKAPGAGRKLKKNDCKVALLTVAEIESILYQAYNNTLSSSKLRKPEYVGALEAKMEKNIGKYEVFISSIETSLEVGEAGEEV